VSRVTPPFDRFIDTRLSDDRRRQTDERRRAGGSDPNKLPSPRLAAEQSNPKLFKSWPNRVYKLHWPPWSIAYRQATKHESASSFTRPVCDTTPVRFCIVYSPRPLPPCSSVVADETRNFNVARLHW